MIFSVGRGTGRGLKIKKFTQASKLSIYQSRGIEERTINKKPILAISSGK